MKILHVSRTMGQGGAEKIVYQLCKDNKEHEQIVISCGGVYTKELKNIGIQHVYMPDINRKDVFTVAKCLFLIWYTVKKEHIDIIHSHHRMGAFYGRLVSILTGAKCVYTAHNIFFDKKRWLLFSLKNSQIVAVGKGVKNNLIQVYGIQEKRIKIIYNSIYLKKLNVFNRQIETLKGQDKILVGNIGRITQQKGIDIFLEALRIVINQNPKVVGVIVGTGDEEEKMKNLTAQLKINNNVLFLGFQKNVLDIISQLDFIVLSSLWEGFPLTPIEVFSQGKTIIASDISGNNEIVEDGNNGILFTSGDVDDLAAKIIFLINNDNLKHQLELNAEFTYKTKFDYQNFIDSYNRVYKETFLSPSVMKH